jgi:1-aminocyclopropane-1-carboxylate deaminase
MFQLPSPLQEISSELFKAHDVNVFVKRDDLIHPFVSGNKIRKLQGWLAHAQDVHAKHLISFGGAYSNHLLALSFVSAILGFKSTGFVRGEDSLYNPVLQYCRLFGMDLKFVSRAAYRDKNALVKSEKLENEYENIVIPEGGEGLFGRTGFSAFLEEPQMEADYYIMSAGTGTTALGIAEALDDIGNTSSKVIAFACVKDITLELIVSHNLILDFSVVGRGFGKYGSQEVGITREFLSQSGILLDPVYTAKAWLGMLKKIETGFFPKGSKIIFVHTGGITGWWGAPQNVLMGASEN